MAVTIEAVQAALKDLIDPNTEKDYLLTRSAKNIKVAGADVSLDIELGYPAKTQIDEIRRTVIEKLKTIRESAISAPTSASTSSLIPCNAA